MFGGVVVEKPRSGLVSASQRSQVEASTAKMAGQPAGRCATSSARSASASTLPRASALYRLPWLRRKHGSRLRCGVEDTAPEAHNVASHNSNSASAQLVNVA